MGISHEEGFLEEEELLKVTINELDQELRTTKQTLEALSTEKEKVDAQLSDTCLQLEQLQAMKNQLKAELKDMRMRESQTMTDFAELEEENVSLQKQLMQIKQAQVEFESIKHENRRFHEELDELKMDIESLNHVKEIVEQNLGETLEILNREREEKHSLKKELDSRITSESMLALQTLASLGLGDFKPSNSEIGKVHFECMHEEHDSPMLKKIEADFVSPNREQLLKTEPAPAEGLVGDLFSEIHMSEIHKLEQMVEQLQMEKGLLERSLDDANDSFEKSKRDVAAQEEKVLLLKTELESLTKAVCVFADSNEELSKIVHKYPDYKSAILHLATLQQDFIAIQNSSRDQSNNDESVSENAIKNYEDTIRKLETELANRLDRVSELESGFQLTEENLRQFSEQLSQIYWCVCEAIGEVPVKSMMQHLRKSQIQLTTSLKETTASEASNESVNKKDSSVFETSFAVTLSTLLETTSDQVKHLNRVVERLIDVSRQNRMGDASSAEELAELQEQVVKLRSMLSMKREQISTLRNVLKQNKATAETAMTNLKQHYDKEKAEINESTAKQRNELMRLKEEQATFAGLRASFAQQCDEYTTQLDELQRQIAAAEEQKKTLNSLLRMALQQKLAIASKLEDLESDRERKNMRPQRASRGRGNRPGGFFPHQGPDENYYRYSPQLRYQRRDY